ncbi:HEAT, type 2 [Phytophthora cactorum]|nr:HEAT, type 2 [Phytophthora cactorum]
MGLQPAGCHLPLQQWWQWNAIANGWQIVFFCQRQSECTDDNQTNSANEMCWPLVDFVRAARRIFADLHPFDATTPRLLVRCAVGLGMSSGCACDASSRAKRRDGRQRRGAGARAEVRALRGKLRDRDKEVAALQEQVAAVTMQLHETSDELECRMTFVADAMTQVETLEAQVAEAKRSILTREMQLHEGEQREKALDAALQGKEKQCELWEGEFHRVDRELSAQKAAQRELDRELQEKTDDVRAWKAKLQAVMTSVDELKLQNTNFRRKERELVATLRQHVEAAEATQRSWKTRLAKRELKIESLRRQCQDRQEELERSRENEERERDKLDVTEQQLDKQKLLVAMREKVGKLTAAVEKAQVKEKLFRKEIFRLREELLLSESHRETEHRRQEELVEGKEKEVAMEDLGFFNEREAECFEREDTLSQSDLDKLNVDENMPEMERAEKLLKAGLDKQKISILNSLPKILANNNSKTNIGLILDCMKGVWQKYESEMNADSAVLLELFKGLASLACATVDGKVLSYPTVTFHEEYAQQLETCWAEKKDAVFLLSDEQITKLLVPFALDIITEIQQKDYAEEASSVVVALLPRIGSALKKTQVQNILRVAIEKGDVSQTPGSRLICCFVLGAVTALNLLSAPDIEGLYFQKMMSLCQDTDAEVRKCMCIQLDGLARAVGEEHACKELLPELLELLNDEEEQILCSRLTLLLCRSSKQRFSPSCHFYRIAESLPDYLIPSLGEQYGQLVTKLATLNHLGNDTGQVFLQGYSKLCSHEELEIRQYCAYNFPAIVKAFGSTYISTLMDDLLAKLASDPSEEVRHHIAAGIHEVAILLGQQRAMRYLKALVLSLMNDESPAVQGMAMSRVPQLLSAMINPNDEDQKVCILPRMIYFISANSPHASCTRLQSSIRLSNRSLSTMPFYRQAVIGISLCFLKRCKVFHPGSRPRKCRDGDPDNFRFHRRRRASSPVACDASRTQVHSAPDGIWSLQELLASNSLPRACVYALTVNSRLYCQRNFLEVAIDLLDDPVPNVRWKAISLVPLWKNALCYLSDEKCLDRIRQFLDESTIDSDRDVANALHETRQVIESNTVGQQRRPQDDVDDKRKLSEEENLGLMTDHEDSSADSKWSSMLEKDGQVVRRARVKSFDLVNKIVRVPGKDTGRTGGMNISGGLGGMSSGSNSMTLAMGIGSKPDQSKLKATAPKTSNKPAPPITTLPNCATARPGHAKMPQAVKVANSTGKVIKSSGPTRSGTGLPKDTGVITKIPIIRPSAPAKRETSPSGSTKPSSATLVLAPAPSSRLGTIDNGGVGALKPQKASGIPNASKT